MKLKIVVDYCEKKKKVVEKHEINERDRPTPPKNEMKKIQGQKVVRMK